jgi:hypothetical protein
VTLSECAVLVSQKVVGGAELRCRVYGPGDSQTEILVATYVVITARGQPIKEIRHPSGKQESPRDEFKSLIRYIKVAQKDKSSRRYDCGESFYHTAALHGTLPFSDPISRTRTDNASGVFPFHACQRRWLEYKGGHDPSRPQACSPKQNSSSRFSAAA